LKIQRANLDGSNIETIVNQQAYQIDLDIEQQKIYWTSFSLNAVFRANFDGSAIEQLVRGFGLLGGVAIDTANDRLFWTTSSTRQIWAANLDGSNPEIIRQLISPIHPLDLEWDATGQHLYFADNGTTQVWRLEADGSDLTSIVDFPDPPPGNLLGVAILNIPEPTSLSLLAAYLALSRRCRKRID